MRNGLGVASLVLGILSIPAGLFVIGIVLGILAVVFGFVGRSRVKRGEADNGGVALAGIITGFVGIAISIVVIVFTVILVTSDEFENLTECLEAADDDQAAIDDCERDFTDSFFDE